jgi:hypothetical protein
MTGTTSADFIPIYFRSAILTIFATLPALLLMAYYRFSPHVPFIFVIASVVMGVLFWLIGLFRFIHRLIAEGGALWPLRVWIVRLMARPQ